MKALFMPRLCLWMLASILVCVFITSAAIAYGQLQPYESPLPALGYDVCNGVPCYLGMISGITAWTDANERVANYQPNTTVNPSATITRFSTATLTGFLVIDRSATTVTTIAVSPSTVPSDFPTLLDLLLFYGEPCSVQVEQYQSIVTSIILEYPHLSIDFPRFTQRLTLDRQPKAINFQAVQNDRCQQSGDARLSWRGLAAYQHYRAQ